MIAFLLNLLQFLLRLIFWLPVKAALSMMYALAWLMAITVLLTPIKKIVQKNIKLVLPAANEQAIASQLIHNLSRSLLEVLCVPYFDKTHLQKVAQFRNVEYLPKNQGAILMTMHAGNYELSQIAISDLGFTMTIILRAAKDPLFNIINRSRASKGAHLVNVLEADMYQAAQKALAQNSFVGILGDTGALESRHEKLDFLGHKVPVATGWLTLAQRSGCPVIPILSHREKGKNIFTLYPPVVVQKDNRQAVLNNFLKICEDFIRQHPEEWWMFVNEYEIKRMVGQ
jgi:KDO2-lipid IV(A) lauroyltransferase